MCHLINLSLAGYITHYTTTLNVNMKANLELLTKQLMELRILAQVLNQYLVEQVQWLVSNLVIANYVLTASIIFSANTIKEATLAQTEELVTINKQLAAILVKIDSFGTTSEKAKILIDNKYNADLTGGFLALALGLGALLFFVGDSVVSAIRRYFRL